MDRREFLLASASGLAALAFPNLAFSTVPKPRAKIERLATDHFELISDHPDRLRILQISDTHMGAPTPIERGGDVLTRKSIRKLIDENEPDFVFHTGDFINNDKDQVEHHDAIQFMNDLGTPWSLVWGNHDHSDGQPGGLSLDAYYQKLQGHAMGYHTVKEGGKERKEYCFRIDIRGPKSAPVYSLFGFNCGGGPTPMIITESQLQWFRNQLLHDAKLKRNHPILVMQHVPTIEYKTLFDEHAAKGRQGENVCFEQDKGAAFALYKESKRVRGVFCGHDHVNDYTGIHDGIRLTYARVSGWSAYGDWQRGGRMIELGGGTESFTSRVVLPRGVHEKSEWSSTLELG